MLRRIWATVRHGKIEIEEQTELPEGTSVEITETDFWIQSSQIALDAVWDNSEDDVYAQLQSPT